MNVTINSKKYTVPQLGFADMTYMEDMGFSVIDILQKQKVFSIATAFVGTVAKCDREEAERLLEQHVLGGGELSSVYEAFMKAVSESGFFKKLLEKAETEKAPDQK